MFSFFRFFLFLLPPEKAHQVTMQCLVIIKSCGLIGLFAARKKYQPVSVLGLNFPNPVGLAAGFDKDGKYIDTLAALGFGFIEVGTVTPLPQPGNPQPRLFRLPKDKALINRMGFNNQGVDQLVEQLQKRRNKSVIIGGNIGKNKNTPNETAVEDYLICFRKLVNHVDYFVVNVSSPNTPGLRELQEKEPLKALLVRLQQENALQPKPRPILLKIAPDLSDSQLDDIVDIAQSIHLDGIIATNTTISREGLQTPTETIGNGGLSGQPVAPHADRVIAYLCDKLPEACILVGVGGIMTGTGGKHKLGKGCSLVQVYTGFIYRGPALISEILA